MDWQLVLLIFFGSLIVLMMLGLPVAFSFLVVAFAGIYVLAGEPGLERLTSSFVRSVASFSLLPLPLFVLMGEVMFHSGIAPKMMHALDNWLGRLPGRLSVLAVGSGTLLATLTGNNMASVAVLGSVLIPDMEKQGYKKPMTLGPILGSGGLAILIPPSGLAVLVGAIGEVSIGKILIGIIIPGLLLALLYVAYIVIRCWLQPSMAPPYQISHVPLSDKIVDTVKYILPLGFIIFMVVGVIFLGVATPTEAAASGAFGTFVLAAIYKQLNWLTVKKALFGTLEVTLMIFMIIATARLFSQVLAFTGASRGMIEYFLQMDIPPLALIAVMQIIVLFLGMFVPSGAHIMIAIPLFMPVVRGMGFDPVWFVIIYLLATEMGFITPPYGANLFVMKGIAPRGTTMADIYGAALPFVYCGLVAMVLIIVYPSMTLWLPNMMR